jgi:hypothetical protein
METTSVVIGLVCAIGFGLCGCSKDKAGGSAGSGSSTPAGASAGAAPVAAGGCAAGATKIDPAGYCIPVPAGYKRDDAAFVDNVLKEKGGGKNIWFSANSQSQITVTYLPGAEEFDSEVSMMQSALKSDSYKQPVDAPTDTPSGKGKFIASAEANGKKRYLDSVTKGAKFVILCKATTPTEGADEAALAACKGLTP